MTSRELVKAALAHQETARAPYCILAMIYGSHFEKANFAREPRT